jgi:hypothetical protein
LHKQDAAGDIFVATNILSIFGRHAPVKSKMLSCAARLLDKNPIERKAPGGTASKDGDLKNPG